MSPTAIVPVMIGTAGHVDHGKTSLVRHLTGRDTDTQPEEQQRGMSIDLGVVPCTLDDGTVAGLIDVPGHEDFIRNMVAGASSVDILLLVIAADDAVMPQTREHLAIARLLGMRSLVVAVTKIDLVPPDLLELVEEDVRSFVRGAGFSDAELIRVSNVTGEGVAHVRKALSAAARSTTPSPDNRAFRMDIRSVYQMKGLGTVVTGVPRSGTLSVADEIELLPVGGTTVVRSIQNYRHDASATRSHVSSALNLRDVPVERVHRGMTAAAPGLYSGCSRAIVTLHNVSPTALGKRSVLRLHCGTAAVTASLRLIDRDELPPGAKAYASLLLDSPLVLAASDPYIVRHLSPSITVGGGRVVSVSPFRLKKVTDRVLERLMDAEGKLENGDHFGAELVGSPQAVYRESDLLRITRRPPGEAASAIREMEQSGVLLPLSSGWLVAEKRADLCHALKRSLARYHTVNPYVWGMKPEYVCEQLKLPAACAPALMAQLTADSELAVKHGRLALESFNPQISSREIRVRDDVLREITRAGIASIARGNLLETLKVTSTELKFVIKLLLDEDQVVILGNSLILKQIYEACRASLLELFREHAEVGINHFREKTGASRNVASAILDSFDAEGLTKRTETGRTLVSRRSK